MPDSITQHSRSTDLTLRRTLSELLRRYLSSNMGAQAASQYAAAYLLTEILLTGDYATCIMLVMGKSEVRRALRRDVATIVKNVKPKVTTLTSRYAVW